MHRFVGKRYSLGVESAWSYHEATSWMGMWHRSSATLEKLYDRSGLWAVKRVYTDRYQAYSEVIGAKRLRQGKQNTYKIEQNNGRQRHWLGRFHWKTVIVSKSIEIVNAPIALFQRFRVNGDIMELISLFYIIIKVNLSQPEIAFLNQYSGIDSRA